MQEIEKTSLNDTDVSQMERGHDCLEVRNHKIDDMFLNLYTDKIKSILLQ